MTDLSDSTCFASVDYDPATQTLDVVFEDGRRQRYYDVPPAKARRLMAQTPSQGHYYNKKIKGQYETRKLPDKENE